MPPYRRPGICSAPPPGSGSSRALAIILPGSEGPRLLFLVSGALLCPKEGALAIPPEETVVCPACGSSNSPQARFCSTCGRAIESRVETRAGRPTLLLPIAILALFVGVGGIAGYLVVASRNPNTATGSATTPIPTASLLAHGTASVTPSASVASMPNGYDVGFCAAYGQFNSLFRGDDTVTSAMADYQAGSITTDTVAKSIDAFDARLQAADTAFARLPSWAPATQVVTEFRGAITAYRTALGHLRTGFKDVNQAEVDKATALLAAVRTPAGIAYAGLVPLSDQYGLGCSTEGLPIGGGQATPAAGQIGTAVRLPGHTVTVSQTGERVTTSVIQPEAGNVYFTVFVTVDVTKAMVLTTFEDKVQSTDGTTYDIVNYPAREPTLDTGAVSAGDKRAGWLTFEVPSARTQGLVLLWSWSLDQPAAHIALN